jgi:hypothetical protein
VSSTSSCRVVVNHTSSDRELDADELADFASDPPSPLRHRRVESVDADERQALGQVPGNVLPQLDPGGQPRVQLRISGEGSRDLSEDHEQLPARKATHVHGN